MITHITYSDERMTISRERCVASALKYGCDKSIAYEPEMIGDFYNENTAIFNQERGAGYWLWKPYIIRETLKKVNVGDIVVYTDAGCEFVSSVHNLIKEMKQDIMVFGNGWRHGDWCKGDVLEAMKAWQYVDCDQIQASCIIVRNSQFAFHLIDEWLQWAVTPGMIDDSPSEVSNEATFREHRHDQAILTNIVLREGIEYNRWPAQYKLRGNEKYRNTYGQVFNHHRFRNNQYK